MIATERWPSRLYAWAERMCTADAVYGSILVAGLIVAVIRKDVLTLTSIFPIVATVIAFWLAHVYANAVADHTVVDGRVIPIWQALRKSAVHSRGLLLSAAIPIACLALGTLGIIPGPVSTSLALWVVVGILAFLGYFAFEDRGSKMPARILGSIVTAAFGIGLILLKAVLH